MDLLAEFFNDQSFIYVFIAGAAGGLFGGLLGGRRASGPSSIIVGTIFGFLGALIIFGVDFPTMVPAGGFPLDWAFGIGGLASYVFSRAN